MSRTLLAIQDALDDPTVDEIIADGWRAGQDTWDIAQAVVLHLHELDEGPLPTRARAQAHVHNVLPAIRDAVRAEHAAEAQRA